MLTLERQNKILDILKKKNQVSTQELKEVLDVSAATIRNDLRKLENEGRLERVHGGAVFIEKESSQEGYKDFHFRSEKNVIEKKSIGKVASNLINEKQTILLDASSTVLYLLDYLHEKERLTLVTNGLYTALEVKDFPNVDVILIGGMLKGTSGAIEGVLGADILSNINIDIMITSAHGFTLKDGLTDFNFYEVILKTKMKEKVDKLIAILDHTKIGRTSASSFAAADEVDILVTDFKTPKSEIDKFRKAGIEVIVADKIEEE